MMYFFFRLNGPRPSFPQDITPDERELMKRHGQYWRSLMAQGKVVVFGPVADPAGAWGLGVMRAEHADEAKAMADQDPVILANQGFGIVIHPMTSAVVEGAA